MCKCRLGGYGCGLFALALAIAIMCGKQPGLFCSNKTRMKEHYGIDTWNKVAFVRMFPHSGHGECYHVNTCIQLELKYLIVSIYYIVSENLIFSA